MTDIWLPTAEQELLLRAALAPADQAMSFWKEWRHSTGCWPADQASYRLMPLLYRRLVDQSLPADEIAYLAVAYRETWMRNVVIADSTALALRTIQVSGIPTMVFKGGALIPLYYHDEGVRPLADIDVLVPGRFARVAWDCLIEAGWLPVSDLPFQTLQLRRHSSELRHNRGCDIDLHWRPLVSFGREERTWTDALQVEVAGTPTLAMAPTDQLLVVLVHGSKSPQFAVQWVADATILLRAAAEQVDWNRLACMAAERGVQPRVSAALDHLGSRFDAPVPETAIRTIGRYRRASPRRFVAINAARLDGWAVTHHHDKAGAVVHHWVRWRKMRRYVGSAERPSDFLQYMQNMMGLENRWNVLTRLVSRRQTKRVDP